MFIVYHSSTRLPDSLYAFSRVGIKANGGFCRHGLAAVVGFM